MHPSLIQKREPFEEQRNPSVIIILPPRQRKSLHISPNPNSLPSLPDASVPMTTTTAPEIQLHPGACGGDGCASHNASPLHHVRHRGVFRKLCTSCVLRCHPGSFCPNCFDLFDGSPPSSVVHCLRCPSISHTACLPDPALASAYLCPVCADWNGFLFFPGGGGGGIGVESAKELLAAAKLALASMSKAVASSRVEAERKSKEAAVAKKRAREMLERSVAVVDRERKKSVKDTGSALTPASISEVAGAKSKLSSVNVAAVAAVAVSAQKRVQCRGKEKLMKFRDPMLLSQVGGDVNMSNKGGSVVAGLPVDASGLANNVGRDVKGENWNALGSKRSLVMDEEVGEVKLPENLDTLTQIPLSR